MPFPIEIWERICDYLPKSDLNTLLCVSRIFFSAAVRKIYKNPQFPPLAKANTWVNFVDLIDSDNGYFEYAKYIEELDDVWLFVGAEDEPCLQRQDSKMDLKFPSYSLYSFLDIMMNKNQLVKLKLHFHSELIRELSWRPALASLKMLDLGIKVTDDILESILICSDSIPPLGHLILRRAEITDQTMSRLCIFKNLKSVTIQITPIQNRSRYFRMIDATLTKEITAQGLQVFFQSCQELEKVCVQCVYLPIDPFLALDARKLTCLSLSLSSNHGCTIDTILARIGNFKHLQELFLYSSSKPDAPLCDIVVNEEAILELPGVVPLKRLVLVGLEICRFEKTNSVYYGPMNSPWEFDTLKSKFAVLYPNVIFDYQSK